MDTLFIRTDADAAVGVGHFMRMLALAEAWVEAGGAVAFGGAFPDALALRARALRAAVFVRPAHEDDSRWTISSAGAVGAKVVVADGYHFTGAFQASIRAAGLRLMVVDDNAENQPYAADWILNVNVHASEAMYSRKNADCRALLGPSFALVRAEFRRLPTTHREPGGRRLLVTMGGADPPDVTGRVLTALRADRRGLQSTVLIGPANPRLAAYRELAPPDTKLLYGVDDVSSVMLQSDVALAGAGGTVWELGLLGVPCVAVALADNQVSLAEELHRRGALAYAGDARRQSDPASWLDLVHHVLDDRGRGEALVSAARALVDGNGASRVVGCIKEN